VAITHQHENMVKLLLAHNVDIEAFDEDGFTALHLAIDYGNERIIDLLLRQGANVEARTRVSETFFFQSMILI